jgi:branched-chain amino acid transport system ATP-binding protein
MLLQVEKITMRFGGLVAVNQASLNVEKGEIFGLIGPNGAGKTTLLNVIAGFYKPSAGKILYQGEDVTGLSPEKLCNLGIARTFQVPRKFQKMSVLENVLVASTFGIQNPSKPAIQYANEALDFAEVDVAGSTSANRLNAGQLKRLDLARAVASQPRLLLLDEPASGLTPAEVEGLMALIRKFRDAGITIIIVEHLMKMIMSICDRMAVLVYGEKIADGNPEEIAKNRKVIEAYLGDEFQREPSSNNPVAKEDSHA